MNVTVPHKETAYKAMDEVDRWAQRLRAVNTIVVRDGVLYGANTDAYGFLDRCERPSRHGGQTLGRPSCWEPVALRVRSLPGFKIRAQRIFLSPTEPLQGKGATGRTWRSGPKYSLGGTRGSAGWRCPDREHDVARHGGATATRSYVGCAATRCVVYDIVYVPLETPLLAAARARGNPAVDGLGMLLHQARPGFRDWFGTDPEVGQVLRDHVLEAL